MWRSHGWEYSGPTGRQYLLALTCDIHQPPPPHTHQGVVKFTTLCGVLGLRWWLALISFSREGRVTECQNINLEPTAGSIWFPSSFKRVLSVEEPCDSLLDCHQVSLSIDKIYCPAFDAVIKSCCIELFTFFHLLNSAHNMRLGNPARYLGVIYQLLHHQLCNFDRLRRYNHSDCLLLCGNYLSGFLQAVLKEEGLLFPNKF